MVDLTRRKTVLGMGLLAGGSGAAFSSAAFSNSLNSEATLGVIADAGLRVRSARNSDNDTPIVANNVVAGDINGLDDSNYLSIDDAGPLSDDYDTFTSDTVKPLIDKPGKPVAAALEINKEVNTDLGIRSAFSNRLDGDIGPLLEITNNDQTTSYNIEINYANDDGTEDGYGNDVSGSHDASNNGEVSRQIVKAVYQFYPDSTPDPGSGTNSVDSTDESKLLSPDPGTISDQGATTYQLGTGEKAFIKMEINTDSDTNAGDLVGPINSAAGVAQNAFTGNVGLSLLSNIYINATQV